MISCAGAKPVDEAIVEEEVLGHQGLTGDVRSAPGHVALVGCHDARRVDVERHVGVARDPEPAILPRRGVVIERGPSVPTMVSSGVACSRSGRLSMAAARFVLRAEREIVDLALMPIDQVEHDVDADRLGIHRLRRTKPGVAEAVLAVDAGGSSAAPG